MLRKNSFLYTFLIIFFSALSLGSWAKTLYWVNNGGNWNDASHWSAVSGGKGGAGMPGSNDDVVFDEYSISKDNQQVNVASTVACHSFTITDEAGQFAFTGNSLAVLNIFGSFEVKSNIVWQFDGAVNFKSSQSGNTIDAYIIKLTNVNFDGVGSWRLKSALIGSKSSTFTISAGTIYANGQIFDCQTLNITGIGQKMLDLTNSTLMVERQYSQTGAQNLKSNNTSAKIYYRHAKQCADLTALNNNRNFHRTAGLPCSSTIDSIGYKISNVICNQNDSGYVADGKIVVLQPDSAGCGPFTYIWSGGVSTTDSATGLGSGIYDVDIIDAQGNEYFGPPINVTVPNPFNLAKKIIRQPKCDGDCDAWIGVKLQGETPNYTYWWNSGPTATAVGSPSNLFYDSTLCAGTYILHMRDKNNCHNEIKFTLTNPLPITLSIVGTPPKCNGGCDGTATVTASGSHGPPFTYKWNTLPVQVTQTAINLCSGVNYVVTVTDDSGCSAKDSITLPQPPPIAIATSQVNVKCHGDCNGSAKATASGGTGPYTYAWSNGETGTKDSNLCAGVYKVVVTDANGCKDSTKVTITQPNPLTVSLSGSPNPLKCNGDCNASISATVSGGTAPYSYSWNGSPGGPSISNQCAGTYKCIVTDAHGCKDSATVTITQPIALITNVTSQIPPTCNGSCNGSITVSVSGGTPGYTLNWQPIGKTTPTVSNLCAGTYTLIVTDKNGCTDTTKITLANPPPLTIVINTTSTLCNGSCNGKGVATVSGGTAPYTYTWNNNPAGTVDSLTGLCTGNDSLTVTDANGCTSSAFFSISQPNPITISVTSNNSVCTLCNGSASISVSGGTLPYTYSWTTGSTTDSATGLCKGTYTVTVTDANNCTAQQVITIVPVVKITITTSAGASVSCFGECNAKASANAAGGTAPYVYSWTNGESGQSDTLLCAGSYTVTVTDAIGCQNTDSISLTQPTAIQDTTTQTNVSCSGSCVGVATDSAYGGTPPYKYSWSTGATTSSINGLCIGTYTVTITDANGCTHKDSVVITQQNSIQANPTITPATCNTSNGAINLAPTGGAGGYTYNWLPGGQTTKNIAGIPAGIYTVTITDKLGCSKTFIIGVSNTTGPGLGSAPKNTTCFNSCNGYDSVFIVTPTTGPYTYLWSPGGQTTTAVSNLCPGIYVCEVTDAIGCITTQSDTIKKPAAISPNVTTTNISCNGSNDGTISFAPTGGVGPYSYTWAPSGAGSSSTNLGPGTYTITITDANGCDSIVNETITQPPVLTLTMSQTNVLCNAACNGTGTVTPSGGTPPYIFHWSNGGVVPTIVFLCPGTYSVTVTDADGCSMLDSVVITQPPALSVSMASTNVSCALGSDGTATLTVSGGTPVYSYSWSNGALTSAISGLSTGTYTVTATDANGCTIIDSVTIIQPTPISISMSSTNATCNGTCDGTATATVSGGTPTYTYSWAPGGMTTSAVSALCGSSTYTVTVTDADGCSQKATITITQPTPLLANASSTDTKCPSSCDGTATSSPVGGTGPYTFLWSNGGVTPTITSLCAGSYTVHVTDAGGCTDSAVVTVSSPTPITASAATAATNCGVCNGTITVTASGGTSPYSYSWSTGATTSTVTSMCAGIYTYTVTDADACTATFTVILNTTSGPTSATVKIANDSCFGQCNGFISLVPVGGTAPYMYSFNSGPLQASDTGLNLCPGTYTIMIQDAAGCDFYDTSAVTQPTAVVNTGVTTNAACIGKCTGTITLTTSGGIPPYAYSWSSGQTTQNLINVCPGTYTDTLTDAKGCPLIQSFTVGQNTAIATSDIITPLLCNGNCNGTASTTASGGSPPYTYIWSDGQTASNAINLCAGTYVDTVKDKNGCEGLDTVVLNQPPALAVTFKTTPITCNNTCDGIIVANVSGGTPAYTYSWNPGLQTVDSIGGLCFGGYTIDVTDANGCKYKDSTILANPPVMSAVDFVTNPSCNNSTDGAITLIPSGGVPPYTYSWSNGANTQNLNNIGPGKYILTLGDATGCDFMDTIIVAPDTDVEAKAGNDTTICVNSTVTLNGSSSISATSYNWYIIPALTPAGNTAAITVTPVVTTSYLLITSDGLCSDSDTVVVNVNPLPNVSAGTSQTIFLFSTTATLGGSPTGPPGSTYLWVPSTGLNDSALANPVASPSVTTTYTVTVTNSFGCSATDTVTIFVLPQFIIPGGFTPNGDGINDYFTINNIDLFPNVTVEIFNRWGEQLFYSTGYKTPWDGNYNGKPLPVGTYYYVINLNDPRFPKAYTGPVTIMR